MVRLLSKPFVWLARLVKKTVVLAVAVAVLAAVLVVLDAMFGPQDGGDEE